MGMVCGNAAAFAARQQCGITYIPVIGEFDKRMHKNVEERMGGAE